MNRDFWNGRSVLITGHTGFKGGWLATWLIDMGARVTGYSREPATSPSYFDVCGLRDRTDTQIGDVCDLSSLTEAIAACRPTVIFHLAAQALVRRSFREPLETVSTNVIGTANVLEAARRVSSVASVLVVTSDKCYAARHEPCGESDPLGGDDPYSASKACAEIVVAAYRRSFFDGSSPARSIATARAGNVIGGGDWAEDRLVPDAIRALQRGETLVLRNPDSVRPWQHVLEPLAGYLTLAEEQTRQPLEFGDCWNFGPPPDLTTTVGEMAAQIIQSWGTGTWRTAPDPSMREARTLVLDSSKARERLRWRSALPLEEAIDWTVEWYRAAALQPRPDMFAFSCGQIREYERQREQGAC